MNNLYSILNNYVLITASISWFTAGVLKVIIDFIVMKRVSLTRVVGSGGMPSSHTSTVVALTIASGYFSGVSSTEFAISVILAIIVIHDAVGVRQETGKQAELLNHMMFDTSLFNDIDFEKRLKEYVGHTPFQVAVGAIVGIIVSTICINIFR